MRFQLLEGWSGPGGAWIEGGTILDGHSFPGMVMPLTAKALDAEAYDAMMSWYSPLLGGNFIHEFHWLATAISSSPSNTTIRGSFRGATTASDIGEGAL
jgi:hypothetical protein